MKKIVIFHPDINFHKTNNEYTIRTYNILSKHYNVRSLEWFFKHPFTKDIHAVYLNWYENTLKDNSFYFQKVYYLIKLLILLFFKFRHVKICCVVHNKTPHNVEVNSDLYIKAIKPFMRRMLILSDVIIKLSNHTDDFLNEAFSLPSLSEKTVLVPHGLYTKFNEDLSIYRKRYNINKSEPLFSFVGRMDRYKNIDVIIKAFYCSNIKGKLLLVGKIDNDYFKVLSNLVLDDRVIIDPFFVSDKDMSCLFQLSDAVILPYNNSCLNSGIMINAFSNATTVIGTETEMLQDFPSDLVYKYHFDNKKHIEILSEKILEAYHDFQLNLIKSKGNFLYQIVNDNNNWTEVERKLLNAIK